MPVIIEGMVHGQADRVGRGSVTPALEWCGKLGNDEGEGR